MTTTNTTRALLDLPEWHSLAPALAASAAGSSIAWDQTADDDRWPFIAFLRSATAFDLYNVLNDEWNPLASPGLGGTFGAGAGCVCMPHCGPYGTLSGGSTTSLVVATTLPVALNVVENQLANRGDKKGWMVRVIGKTSGKTEERRIVANSAHATTPTLFLDPASPLSFTPQNGDLFEILSPRIFLLSAGAAGGTTFRSYDVALNAYASLAYANLPATIATDSDFIAFSEAYVPSNRTRYEGFLGVLVATASAAGTITGQTALGDVDVLANEYRNFAIRIVEDTGTPAAVGQRRKISSHTAGPSAVYTLASNWTTTPSATAKFVIENHRDRIMLFTSASAPVYTYDITANTWSSTEFASRVSTPGAGVCGIHSYSLNRELRTVAGSPTLISKQSLVFSPRGGAANTIDVLDIAAGATGVWSLDVAYQGKGLTLFNTGTSCAIDPASNDGCFFYAQPAGTQRFARFCMRTRTLEPWGFLRYGQGAAIVGQKIAILPFVDGSTRIPFLFALRQTAADMFRVAVAR